MKYEIDIDIPEGYELTGEFRNVNTGEQFLYNDDVKTWDSHWHSIGKHLIVRKIKWVPKYGNGYYYLDGKEISYKANINDPIDRNLIAIGNFFQTLEEATVKFELFLKLMKMTNEEIST